MTSTDLTNAYDAAAPSWNDTLQRLGYVAAYAELIARLPDRPIARLCDMGAGSGGFAAAYLAHRSRPRDVVLVDPARQMLKEAAKRVPGADCVCGELSTYSASAPFDVVLASHVIEHCEDPAKALRHLARLTAPGGRLVLIVSKPHWCQWVIWLRWRHRWFSAQRVLAWGRDAGLALQGVHAFASGPPRRTSLGYIFKHP